MRDWLWTAGSGKTPHACGDPFIVAFVDFEEIEGFAGVNVWVWEGKFSMGAEIAGSNPNPAPENPSVNRDGFQYAGTSSAPYATEWGKYSGEDAWGKTGVG